MPKRTRLPLDVILPFVPVTVAGLASCFRRAAKDRLSLDVRKFSQHPFRAKRFRKIFRSACARVGLDDDLRRAFMGHTGSASMNYLEASKEELVELYKTIEPLLSVHKIIISTNEYDNAVMAYQSLNIENAALKIEQKNKEEAWEKQRKSMQRDLNKIKKADPQVTKDNFSKLMRRLDRLEKEKTS